MGAVSDFISANRERFLAELCELLRYPSVYGNDAGLRGAANWVEQRLEALGATVKIFQGGDAAPIVFGEVGRGPRSLLSYTHYDVQPPDPLDDWTSPPFEPVTREGKLYGRGAADDKGDTVARMQAIEVYRALYGDLPLRVKFLVEGDEERGSPYLDRMAAENRDLLRADGAIWEGGGLDEAERYTVYCGVKGIHYLELRVQGPAYDLHSSYAPVVPNPAWRLVEALGTLKNSRDEITVDGFMDHVRPPSPSQMAYIRRIPFAGAEMKASWGIPAFINDMTDEEALWAYLLAPTCTICGLRSGFTGDGTKTILPSDATAKLDFRLVPDLTPELVLDLLRKHLDRRGFTDVEIRSLNSLQSMASDVDSPVVRTVVEAARAIYGGEPVIYPSVGGSGPMYSLVGAVGTPGAVMAGLTYPGMRMHAPNENIRLDDYFRHIEFLVEFLRRFSDA